jgi:crossover junction endodeoxyribonuclease RuvC
MALILGIDPGSRKTGFALLQTATASWEAVDYDTLPLKEKSVSTRLGLLHERISAIIEAHQPDCMAIEEVFVHINPQSALKLAQARGAILACAGRYALPVHAYAPRAIKQAISGYGGANKQQMQWMMRTLLHLKKTPAEDAADALAVAWCHAAHSQNLRARHTTQEPL